MADQRRGAGEHVHRAIIVAAHNPILLELFDSFTPRLRQTMLEMLRIKAHFGSDDDQQVHVAIVDAIANRDAVAAAALSRTHPLALKSALG